MKAFMDYMFRTMKTNFTDWDYGFLKLYGGLFGLMMGAFFPEFVKGNLVIFITVFLILMFRYLYLLFIKDVKTEVKTA